MNWVQWKGAVLRSKVHATLDGKRTLCNQVIGKMLIQQTLSPPDDKTTICKPCIKIEEEGRKYR